MLLQQTKNKNTDSNQRIDYTIYVYRHLYPRFSILLLLHHVMLRNYIDIESDLSLILMFFIQINVEVWQIHSQNKAWCWKLYTFFSQLRTLIKKIKFSFMHQAKARRHALIYQNNGMKIFYTIHLYVFSFKFSAFCLFLQTMNMLLVQIISLNKILSETINVCNKIFFPLQLDIALLLWVKVFPSFFEWCLYLYCVLFRFYYFYIQYTYAINFKWEMFKIAVMFYSNGSFDKYLFIYFFSRYLQMIYILKENQIFIYRNS